MSLSPFISKLKNAAEDPAAVTVAYKLAAEAFFLTLILAAGFLLVEIVLPGFVTARLNFSAVYVALILFSAPVLWLSGILGTKKAAGAALPSPSWKTVVIFSLLATALLANDTWDLTPLQRITSLLAVFFGAIALFSVFLAPGKKRSK